MWWWLSVADPSKPRGRQAMGVMIVEGADQQAAQRAAGRIGSKHGIECFCDLSVIGTPLPDDGVPGEHFRNRFITAPEVYEIGEVMRVNPAELPTARRGD